MVLKFRKRKSAVLNHVMAKLGKRMGPFYTAKAAVEAAKLAGRELGLTEDELLKFMTRSRKITSGPLKDTVQVVVPVVLYELNGIHETDDFYWNDSFFNQSGFLPYKYTPKGATRSKRRFGYVNDVESDGIADSHGGGGAVTSASIAATATASLPRPIREYAQAAAAVGIVPLKAARSVPFKSSAGGISNGALRLGQRGAIACAAAAATVKIPRKPRVVIDLRGCATVNE
jgi:hypothetical protein